MIIMRKTLVLAAFAIGTASTGAQQAHFEYFSYEGNDTRFDRQIDHSRQYFNPVLAGFYPDPSFCRKGDTYYLVNSSFAFFPGVPVFKSKDLVNWTQIGHVLDRESQLPLSGQGVSGGIYAPDIKYNEKNKTFYMITTNVGTGNFYVKSEDPEKGWSEPVYLPKIEGIDPSFFFDKDGKGYIVHNAPVKGGADYEGQCAIRLLEFDVQGDSIIGEPVEILRGGTHVEENPIWIEGPHLYRIGRYYYLMCAEGGTGDRHSEVILRAKSPKGPWEEYTEGNPILTQRTGLDPERRDIVTSTGHADMLQTDKGDWWAVFLGCRPYADDYYNTGRDTYMLPVTWKDGWPTILEKGTAVPAVAEKTGLAHGTGDGTLTGNFAYTDRFEGDKLNMRWIFLRNPDSFYSLENEGLTIAPKAVNILQKESPSAIFTRQQHNTFTAETSLSFAPGSEKDLAGITLLQNEAYNFVFGKTMVDGKQAITLTRTEETTVRIGTAFIEARDENKPIRLKICGNGRYYDFYYAIGDGQWQTMTMGADAVNLSTHRSGGFIGTCIGLYATTAN